MRVLLISVNTEQINMAVLPLGLACIAAASQQAGHRVKFVNLMSRQNMNEEIEQTIHAFEPEVIGISVRNIDDQVMNDPTFLLDLVREVVKECRNLSRSPIVLGGAGYSIFPREVLEYLDADFGIQGEGEAVFVSLLNEIARGGEPRKIPGVLVRGAAEISPPRRIKSLDLLPLPLPNVLMGSSDAYGSEEVWLPFQTRRGCPMNCSYCSTAAIEGQIIRKRSPAKVVESLASFAAAGFDRFFFVDNTFNLPPSYAKELCQRLVAAKLSISWRCILYPHRIDEALIAKMAEAGCKEVSLGFESGSIKMLRSMNKKFEPEEVRHISKLLKKYGVRTMGFLLLGGPGETKETVEESFSFADSLQLDSMKMTVGIRIYPHTLLARIALREGIIRSIDDLLFPQFYLEPGIRDWLLERVAAWTKERPNWHC